MFILLNIKKLNEKPEGGPPISREVNFFCPILHYKYDAIFQQKHE